MATEAVFAQGTLVARGDGGSPEVFTNDIAELKTITGPTMRAALIDVTTQQSPDAVMERISGLIDPGEISFDINYSPSNGDHVALLNDFVNRTKANYQVQMAGGSGVAWQMNCQVVGFELTAPVDGALTAAVTLAVLGKPDFAA